MAQCLKALSVFVLGAAALLAQTVTPATDTRTTGVIGIASGETARFNVLNDFMDPSATATTCSVVLTFFAGDGAQLKTSTVSIAPGTTGSVELFSNDLSLVAVGQRREIRATFAVPLIPNTTSPPSSSTTSTTAPATVPTCHLVGTLEIFDALTGRTQAVLGGTHSTSEIVPAATGSN